MTTSRMKVDKASWQSRPLCDRITYMGTELHVSHPDFVRAMMSIKNGVVNCEQLNSGSGLLVLAPTGAGKSYLRDYLIFLLSVMSQTPVLEVCQWSRQRCFSAIEIALNDMRSQVFAIVVREAQHLFETYQSTNFSNDSSHTEYYFVTRFGLPVAAHSIRRRVSAMMKFRFEPDLWQSVDVFTKVFLVAKPSRRQRLLQTED